MACVKEKRREGVKEVRERERERERNTKKERRREKLVYYNFRGFGFLIQGFLPMACIE